MSDSPLTRGWHLYELGRYEQALSEAMHARTQPGLDSQAAYLSSLCLTMLERHSEAQQTAVEGLGNDPESSDLHHAAGYAYYRQALDGLSLTQQFFRKKREYDQPLAEAERYFREAIRLRPNASHHHLMLARVLGELEQNDAAEQAVCEALRLDPQNASGLTYYSFLCRQQKRYSQARSLALSALSIEAQDASGHNELGWSKLLDGQTRQAMSDFTEALRINPDNDSAKTGLVEALKNRHFFIRLPYGLLNWLWDLPENKLWVKWKWLSWPLTAIIVTLLVLVIAPSPIGLFVGFLIGLKIGLFVWIGLIFLPLIALLVLTMCNTVLLLHPLGRHALTPWQRYRAVAVIGYALPIPLGILILIASLLIGPGEIDPVAPVFAVVSLMLLAGPFAAWAAASTTRWSLLCGIIAVISTALWAAMHSGLPYAAFFHDFPMPHALFLMGTAWGLMIPSRL